jgi:hypothetical protein
MEDIMGKFGQMAMAAVGAMLLTVTSIVAAVGPAWAVDPAPARLAAVQLSGQAVA